MADYPIPYDPSWDVRDSSKLSDDFLTCPRKYFYRNLLGWKTTFQSNDLVFGSAAHASLEYLLLHGYEQQHILPAFEEFLKIYRPVFPEDTDELYAGKTPDGWINALALYTDEYAKDLENYEVLYTEIAGTVPVDATRILHFRMDSVLRDRRDGKIISLDHKTKKGDFNRMWEDKFQLANQTGTYTHCLYCLYPMEEVKGMKYNGIALKHLKTKGHQAFFKRVPAYASPKQMQTWLWNIVDTLDSLDMEMDRLSDCSDSDDVLQCFPINPESCTKYFGCPYHDFCTTWANPLRHCQNVPMGFEVEFWDPSKEPATNNMELKWEGK